jgi:hypothetical protein
MNKLIIGLVIALAPAVVGAQVKNKPVPQVKKTQQEAMKEKADLHAASQCGRQAKKQQLKEKSPEFGRFMSDCLRKR